MDEGFKLAGEIQKVDTPKGPVQVPVAPAPTEIPPVNEIKQKQSIPANNIKRKVSLPNIKNVQIPNSKNLFSKLLRILIGVILVTVIIVIIYATNIDTAVFKISLSGQITDSISNTPIPDVNISIGDKVITKSDVNGRYIIKDLELGTLVLKISATGYEDLSSNVNITRSFMDYTLSQNFKLQSKEKATLQGKFIGNIENYKYLDDKLRLNDKDYKINEDGSFTINDTLVGKNKLEFQSINFKDISTEIEIKSGTNKINDIQLEQAGDIEGEVISFVREDIVLTTKFFIENVETENVVINDDGKFKISDLEVGRSYKFRVIAEGYLTRDYDINIKQGFNELFGFKLVENGITTYVVENDRGLQFFKSEFDGKNTTQISNFDRDDIIAQYYNSVSKLLYFQSDRENIRASGANGNIFVPYALDVNTGKTTRILATSDGIGKLYPNFRAQKMANIFYADIRNGGTRSILQLRSLDGTASKTIRSIDDPDEINFENIKISDNGRYIFWSEKKNNISTLFKGDFESGEANILGEYRNLGVFDVSENGEKILMGRLNTSTGFNDLVIYNLVNNETKTITSNYDGFQYQFQNGTDNQVIYFATRQSRSNIYRIDIEQNKDERITSMGAGENIRYLYQNDDYSYYITTKGLYIIDFLKPQNFKLVNPSVREFTGFALAD